jgi:hypothetical protein
MSTPEFRFVTNAISEPGKSGDYILFSLNFAMAASRRW